MEDGKTIIEVNGVKLEVDLRTARRVDELRVGDRVKVLVTQSYDKSHKVYAGTVIGFEPFAKLPTIIVAYVEREWSGVGIKFVYFNKQTENIEIIKAIYNDQLDVDKSDVLAQFDKQIYAKKNEVSDLEQRRAYFLANFRAYWPEMSKVEA
jgi:ribosomal protein L19